MGFSGGYGAGSVRRSFSRDSSVKDVKIARGTGKRIIRFAWPYKKILAVFLILVILEAVINVANPLIYREIINKGIINHQLDIIINLAILIAGLAVAAGGLTLGQSYISAKIGQGLIFDMRTKVFEQVQRMPLAFFTRVQTGALVSRLNNDVLGAQESFTNILSSVIGNFISVVFVLITMFILSWRLTLVALILLPFFALPARWFGRKLQEITKEKYEISAEMNTIMIERFNVAGALLTKLFGQPKREEKIFGQKASRVRDIGISQGLYARSFHVALMMTASLAIALVYGWGGVLSVRHMLDVGTLIALAAYLNRLYGPLTSLSNVNLDVMTALVSFERVFEVLDLKPMITEKPNAISLPKKQVKVELKNVNFKYPGADEVSLASLESVAKLEKVREKDVLFDISFTVNPGQMVALVGPSGAGKSTLTQLVARLYDPTSGEILMNGINLRDLKFSSLRSTIGVVSQDAHMFHDTIRANLLYAKPSAREKEIIESLRAAQISELIESLPQGLDTVVGDRGHRLSGGEKQRLAIARLILKSPNVVILDEATAHLDSQSERAIQIALETILSGRTSLVIAHRLSTIKKADKILVIDKGRIVDSGNHVELLERGGLYAKLYHTQFADVKKN